jgi:hypothetical protein
MQRFATFAIATVLAIGGLVVAGSLFFGHSASAAGPTIKVDGTTAELNGGGSVNLFALGFGSPGLGAWTIDVTYDPAAITAQGCAEMVQVSFCNAHYSGDTVRSAGANATGIVGDSTLARIDFACKRAGTSMMHVVARDVSDATIGGPQLLSPVTVDGAVICPGAATSPSTPTPVVAPSVPHAGTGGVGQDATLRVLLTLGMLLSAGVLYGAGVRAFARRED